MRTSSLLLLALVVLCAHLNLCAAGGNAIQSALVRVAHAAPTTPPVDLYVNGNPFLVGLPYTEVSSYLLLPARQAITFDVRISGAPNVTVFNFTTELTVGTPLTKAPEPRALSPQGAKRAPSWRQAAQAAARP